jgi:hypothetical protein
MLLGCCEHYYYRGSSDKSYGNTTVPRYCSSAQYKLSSVTFGTAATLESAHAVNDIHGALLISNTTARCYQCAAI